ncbi:hypothetical protein [Marivirga lumbricoides]|uniref:hypothetical protein n=1 Tax=Marivirga lumbricoides TaxID=1046115 RepID=UPI00166B1175
MQLNLAECLTNLPLFAEESGEQDKNPGRVSLCAAGDIFVLIFSIFCIKTKDQNEIDNLNGL